MNTPLQFLTRPRGRWRGLLLLAVVLLLARLGHAQVDTYTFAASSGTFTPLPATATSVTTINADDAVTAALPIGFNFTFDGTVFTQVYANSNGFLSFNAATPGSGSYTNSLTSVAASYRPLVAPYWDDLTGTGGTASYQTSGTAPNRTFTFEWLNWRRLGATGPQISMQAQLVEGSNVVRFAYRPEATAMTGASVSIGLAGTGTGAGSFLSLSDTSPTPTASATTETATIATVPAAGQLYTFTPPVPSPCPTPRLLTATAVTATGATLGFSVSNATPGPFTVQYGVAGFNPAQPSSPTNLYTTVTTTTTSATVTGLNPNTNYQFYVTQNCGGANGNSASSNAGAFTTLPTPAANNDCAQAVALVVASSCTTPVSGTVFGATQSLPPSTGCGGTVANDVWYSFVASASAQQLTTAAQFSGYYDVRSGSCATSTSVGCGLLGSTAAPSQVAVSGLTTGQTYFLRVYSTTTTTATASGFTLCLTPVLNYCNTGLGGSCGGNDITAVNVSTLNATGLTCTSTGGQAYTNYPASGSTTGTLLAGVTYQLSATIGAGSIASVWIDYNQNLALEANEFTQITTSSTGTAPTVVPITIPANALQGPTRMRIRTRSAGSPNGATDACSQFFSGETKDFTVTIGPPPTCAPPTSLSVSNVSTTSATLTFGTSNGTATGYVVQYGPTGFNPTLPSSATNVYTTVNTTALSVPVTGLTANTSYQFYVTKSCGAGSTSQTAGPFTFTTLCLAPVYAALPLTESFENTWLNGCATHDVPTTNWRNTPINGDASWRREDDGASAAWTSPGSWAYVPTGSQGTHSARFHSGEANNGDIGTFDLYVNLSAAGAKRLSFDYINTSGTDSLVVLLSNDGGGTFTRLVGYNRSGTAAAFVTQVLPISSTSATAVIRFRGRADFGTTDIGLDNIVLESATGCLTPANLTATTTTTTASLSWLTGGTGTYTVVYGPTGFNPALPSSATNVYTTVSGLTGPPYAITGLTPGTTYQFYVTLNCTGGTNSGTAGPASFSTQILNDEPCGAVQLTINTTCTPLATTTVGATATTGVPAGSCSGFPATAPLDVWFKFTTTATGPTATQVRLSVTGASANTIRLYSGPCAGPLAFVACSSSTNSTTAAPNLDATGLLPSTTYYVRVGLYTTFQPAPGNITICATPVPNCATPTGLTVGTLTGGTAVLNWAAAPVTGSTFTVYYELGSVTPPGGTAISGLTGTSTTLTNLLPNTTYCFSVQQVCGGFNGSSTYATPVCFTTPLTVPTNDDPCGAVTLGAATVNGSTSGATTSAQAGIPLPTCSSAQLPKDVWFAFTATTTSYRLAVTGTAAGLVRVLTSPSCSAGPFAQLPNGCFAGPGPNQNVGPVALSGLTVGTRYYVAVSGYSSSDTPGSFTILGTVTATRAQADTDALLVYPNPSNTGQLTLRLSNVSKAGEATLLNALGQVVATKSLSATTEQTLNTRGLATGVYTLRVTVAGQVLTRKVVLE